MRLDKREFVIVLIKEMEYAAAWNNFRSVYHITKKLACDRKLFDGLIKDDKGRLLIYNDEQLKR